MLLGLHRREQDLLQSQPGKPLICWLSLTRVVALHMQGEVRGKNGVEGGQGAVRPMGGLAQGGGGV